MRCRCCDNDNSYYWKGEYYCGPCRQSIVDTIKEDRFLDYLKHIPKDTRESKDEPKKL